MADWVGLTGKKRGHDLPGEDRPVKPQAQARQENFASQVAGLNTESIMEKAIADRTAQYIKEQEGEWDAKAEMVLQEGDKKNEDEQAAEVEKDGAGAEEEDSLEALRARRRKQMQEAQEKRMKHQALGHGSYDEIEEEAFLKTVTSSNLSVVHFYHRHFEKCKIMDHHLSKCAKKFFGTRFVKLDAEKAHFFVAKLAVKTLPCAVVFVDGVAKGRQVGFDGLGGEEFRTAQLAYRFKEFGGIEEDVDPEDEDL
eukprot:TRINITY_DN16630_c2_g1_i1.p1 TRINITY_DN16630_c2_g1~~TRINITY_DN16630_c2_g1_i1.p1  ORF type:complete len:253 (-),score=84.64 TRINITY_DN16630_c2_g1_i1:173-931(-)